MSAVENKITSTDEQVRGYPGTVARCACGFSSVWAVRDGSAESDGDRHMRTMVPGYAERQAEWQRQWHAENETRIAARVAELEARKIERPTPTQAPTSKPCHDCSCHFNPPCGACERCVHIDYPECPNDCQTCEEPHEY